MGVLLVKDDSIWKALPWHAFGLAGLVWLMSLAYGFQYLVMDDKAAHFLYFRIATVPYTLVLVLLTYCSMRPASDWVGADRCERMLGVFMMSFSWILTCFFNSFYFVQFPWFVAAIALPLCASIALAKSGNRAALVVFLIGALVLFVTLIARIPHDEGGGDMLQIIDFAATDWLKGDNPFRPYLTVSRKEVPFGYWPGIWLPYVPLIALGIDMRVLNISLYVLIALLFWKVSGGGERGATMLAIALLPFLLSPQILQMIVSGHLWFYWLLLVWAFWLIVQERNFAAAVLLGLCLATRPTVLFVLGPVFAFVWSRGGFSVAARCGLLAIAVMAAANVPFFLVYGEDFVRNSYGALGKIGQDLTHFSVLGILEAFNAGFLGKFVQVGVVLAACAAIAVNLVRTKPQFVMFCGCVYIWEVLFASYATRYTYFGGFLLVGLGIVMSRVDKKSEN